MQFKIHPFFKDIRSKSFKVSNRNNQEFTVELQKSYENNWRHFFLTFTGQVDLTHAGNCFFFSSEILLLVNYGSFFHFNSAADEATGRIDYCLKNENFVGAVNDLYFDLKSKKRI